jgi:hypothetical protein
MRQNLIVLRNEYTNPFKNMNAGVRPCGCRGDQRMADLIRVRGKTKLL